MLWVLQVTGRGFKVFQTRFGVIAKLGEPVVRDHSFVMVALPPCSSMSRALIPYWLTGSGVLGCYFDGIVPAVIKVWLSENVCLSEQLQRRTYVM